MIGGDKMANPQLENGYMRVANEILDALGKVNLNRAEQKVVWCVLRYTYGFNRKSHGLSASFIAHWGNCSVPAVKRALKVLREANVIIVLNTGERGMTSELAFNKNYDAWNVTGIKNDTSIKNDTIIKSDTTPVSEVIPQPVSEVIPKKEQREKTNLKNKHIGENDLKTCLIKEVVDFLNSETGKNFRWQTQATQRFINARLTEGFVLKDFRRVIEHKTSEWKGTDMEKYLRPETLFGTKFEGYLNAAPEIEQQVFESEKEETIDLWSD